MKKIMCETCGSSDLVRDVDFFVCQNCGMKYTLDAVQRMRIEGTVDIRGTVKVDNSAFIEKYLANARRAKEKEDWEEAEKYYNMVEQNEPKNIEAIFYSAYAKAMGSLIISDIYKREAAFKVLNNCVSLIDDNYAIGDEEKNTSLIEQISSDILSMSSNGFVFNQTKTGYGIVVSSDKNITLSLFSTLHTNFVNSLIHIIAKYPEGDNRRIPFYSIALEHVDYMNTEDWEREQTALMLHEEWRNIDASHIVPENLEVNEKNENRAIAFFLLFIIIIALIITALSVL